MPTYLQFDNNNSKRMKDRYKLNLFYSGKESAHKYVDAQEINGNVFTAKTLRINLLAMDFPVEVTLKQRKALEENWINLLPRLDLVTTLSCRHRVNQTFFEAICKMKNLEHLHFLTSTVEDISSISKLQKLRRLEMESFSRLVDISPILALKSLELLSVESSFKVENYDVLGQMTTLVGLRLGGNNFSPKNLRLKSLKPFKNLKHLKHLDLSLSSVIDFSYETILDLDSLERFDTSILIPKPIRQLIKVNNKKLTAGFFVDYDFDNNAFYEGKEW
jgi:hypothetical protein